MCSVYLGCFGKFNLIPIPRIPKTIDKHFKRRRLQPNSHLFLIRDPILLYYTSLTLLWTHPQYSLLQTASETCQKKRHCKFTASARAFGGDPCPGVKKFVEVAFKCRPCKYMCIYYRDQQQQQKQQQNQPRSLHASSSLETGARREWFNFS